MVSKFKKDIKNAVGLLIPRTELLLFFWFGYTLSISIFPWLGEKMVFFAWFLLSGNIMMFYSKRLQAWIRKKADE